VRTGAAFRAAARAGVGRIVYTSLYADLRTEIARCYTRDRRRDQVIYYEYKADRTRGPCAGIDEQITKAEKAVDAERDALRAQLAGDLPKATRRPQRARRCGRPQPWTRSTATSPRSGLCYARWTSSADL
jgi:hypothetical protein